MKKVYRLRDLDCANCAAKMEARIKKIPGVTDATVSFMTQKMTVISESDDQSELIREIIAVIKKVEPDCEVIL